MIVLVDKANDAHVIPDLIEGQNAVPNILSTQTGVGKVFCRLKDYRRIGTRYDK